MEKIFDYFKDNVWLSIIAIAIIAVIVILIITACILLSKKKKNSSAATTTSQDNDLKEEQKSISESASSEKQNNNSPVLSNSASNKDDTQISSSPDDIQSDTVKNTKEQASPASSQSLKSSEPTIDKTISAPDDEKKYTGKWIVRKNAENNSYYFTLHASNGEKLLQSIEYTSVQGAKNGIKTHKNNILKGNIVISRSKNNQYFFKILNGSKQLLCTGETYKTKSSCENAADSVKRFAESAVVIVEINSDNE